MDPLVLSSLLILASLSSLSGSEKSDDDEQKIKNIVKEMENCDIERVVLEAEEFIEQQKSLSLSTSDSPRAPRFLSPDVFIDGGIVPGKTYMGPALSTVVDFLQLSKVTHEFEQSLFGAATCTFCKASFLFLQYYLDKNMALEEVKENAKMLCQGVTMMLSHEVCTGLIDNFTPDLHQVLTRTSQSPENICGFMFGEACDNPHNPQHDWDIRLPPPTKEVFKTPRRRRRDANSPLVILHISDTHWDPLYKEGTLADCKDFLCCREESGQVRCVRGLEVTSDVFTLQVFDEDEAAGYWGDKRKCDTPLRTIEAMYRHIRTRHPDLDMIYWTGDLPPHDIWKQTRQSNLEIVRATARQLRDHFPDVPVYPALGNHESVPVDSFPPPAMEEDTVSMSWLHSVLEEEWGAWLQGEDTWSVRKGAYYSVSVAPGLRVVSLNMNYCMNKNLWLLLNSTDPAHQLQWLVYELQLAEFAGEKVHILGHVPPGHVDCVRVWSRNFNEIINRYADTVTGQFYGHTHVDEFQLFYSDSWAKLPTNVAYIAPSVTPYHGTNPSYRLYTVAVSGEMLDHQTFIMDIDEANKSPEKEPDWPLLYSAKAAYNMEDLSPASWQVVVHRLQTDKIFFNTFFKNYHGGIDNVKPCDPNCRRRLICSLVSSRSHQTEQTCRDVQIGGDTADTDTSWWWFG